MTAHLRPGRLCTVLVGALGVVLLLPATGATGATGAPARSAPGLAEALADVQDASGPVRVVVQTVDADGRPTTDVTVVAAGRAEQVLREAAGRAGTAAVGLDQVVHATGPTGTDPLRPRQWQLRGLQAPAVWAVPGADQVVVAVVDSGVDASHPDLAGSVLPGHDYVEPGGDGTDDESGHGTHVAGIITAHQGDGVGVAGIRPGTKVLPVRVLDENGEGFTSDVADGITLAADQADVINLSLGSPARDAAVENAVRYALDRGVTVVVSSGNSRLEGDPRMYPAAQPGVVAVGATGRDGLVAPYSSTGGHLAVAAPGTDVLSTVPGGRWVAASGTSMAAPHVSAVAAAMLAVRPDLTPAQVRSTLVSTAADLAPAGPDRASGAGLVQPVAALRALGASPVAVPGPPTTSRGLPRDLDSDGRADLLAVAGDGALLRYRADGTGGIAGRSVAGKGWQVMDLVTSVGDWDGDGSADVIARRSSDAALVLYRGNGAGGWLGTRVLGSRWSGIDSLLSPSDWNGDGYPDLVARRSSDRALLLFPGSATGALRPYRQIGSRWGGVSMLSVLGDWDGDGAADLGARDASGRLVMFPGDGTGGFGVPQVIGTGWGTVRALAGPGDWDGDRRPDLLAVTSAGDLRVYPSNGTGGFARSRTVQPGWSSLRPAV